MFCWAFWLWRGLTILNLYKKKKKKKKLPSYFCPSWQPNVTRACTEGLYGMYSNQRETIGFSVHMVIRRYYFPIEGIVTLPDLTDNSNRARIGSEEVGSSEGITWDTFILSRLLFWVLRWMWGSVELPLIKQNEYLFSYKLIFIQLIQSQPIRHVWKHACD